MNIVQVIDHSSSMDDDGWDADIGHYQPIADVKLAAKQFVDLMREGDQIGVVSFSSSATLNHGLTTISGPEATINSS